MSSCHTWLAQWEKHLLEQRRLSPHTAAAYRRDVQRLFDLAAPTKPTAIQTAQIRQALASLHHQGEQPRSLSRRLSAWRRFFAWLDEHDHLSGPNPCLDVRAPKAPQPLPSALSVEQTQQLLDQGAPTGPPPAKPDREALIAYRDQALFELFYSCGLRLSELVSLDYRYVQEGAYRSSSWVDQDNHSLRVQGKGQKTRIVPIGRHALQALQYWLKIRTLLLPAPQDLPPEQSAALFLGQRGRRIHPRVVQQQLARRAQAVGLAEHVHPHRLRHSFASHILQSSQDLRAVQEMLGHENIRSTQIYTRLDFQHLAKIYDQSHPRAKKSNTSNTSKKPLQKESETSPDTDQE